MTVGEYIHTYPEPIELDKLIDIEDGPSPADTNTLEIPDNPDELTQTDLSEAEPQDIEEPTVEALPPEEANATFLPGATASEVLENLSPETMTNFYRGLLGHARRMAKSTSLRDPEDFVAETFAAFIAKGESVSQFHHIGGLFGYLRGIQEHKIADYFRKAGRRPRDTADTEPFEGEQVLTASAETQAIGHLALNGIVKALIEKGELDQHRRALLFELLYPSKTREQLAKDLGMPAATIRKQIFDLRKKLQKLLPEVLGSEVWPAEIPSGNPVVSLPKTRKRRTKAA